MKKAFTLIELLVVIAIIALLSTLSVVALNSARAKSRDARRLSDIKNTQTALEMYFDTAGEYPATLMAGNELSYGGLVFLAKVPSDPISSNQYVYAQTESGQSYTLDFTTETKSSNYEAGNYQATPNGILAGGGGSTPPQTWVCGDNLIDGSEQYMTMEDHAYCLMIQNLVRSSNKRRCYGDIKQNCIDFGGLYAYKDKDSLCPSGWRLPKDPDDNMLFEALVNINEQGFIGYFDAKALEYKNDRKYLMLDSSDDVLDSIGKVGSIPFLNSSVAVRCIKELY